MSVVPPQNLEAEESVLGAMLISPNAIDAVRDILDAGDFYRESHGRIYRRALALHDSGEPVDAITLAAALEEAGEIEQAGGRVRLHELARLVPATANVRHYATIVRDASVLRSMIRIGGEIAQLGWEREGDALDLIGEAQELVAELRARRGIEQDEMVTLHQAAEYLDAKFRNPPDESDWIPGPWSFVPRMGPGRMYVLGGYAKDGKTAAACQFFHRAARDGHSTTFLTLEMSKWDLTERLAAVMGIPARTVQTGRLGDDQQLARNVLGEMTQLAPHARVWDAPAVDIPTIRSHVKGVRPKLLIVDHLHQFHLRSEYERQDLENVVRGLWRIAREFSITVLLLAQLSRAGDKKNPYPMPTMSAVKGSGAIEQLAWAVWFVYRQRDDANLPTDESLFVVAANRSGITGTRRLQFHPKHVRYGEIAREA